MEPQLNLLLTLHHLAVRQDENFTTAALVNLLRHLALQHPEALLAILNRFGEPILRFTQADLSKLAFETWATTPHGNPDIRIRTSTKLLLVEVKVSAKIGPAQVADYLAELRDSPKHSQKRLVLLTRYPVLIEPDPLVEPIRWYELADLLHAHRPASQVQPAAFLTDQFLEFAYGQSLMVAQLRSGISVGLRRYLAAEHEDSMFTGRVRHLSRLAKHHDLKGLHDLLLMLEEVLRRSGAATSAKLDSGHHEGGWIGYNLDNLHYFFYVRLRDPEVVRFQDYSGNIVREAVPPGMGRLSTTDRRLTWNSELDLASEHLGFFGAPKREQLRLLEHFYLTSRSLAEKIEAASAPAV